MTEDFDEYFKEHFRFTCYGKNLWRAYNKITNEPASPVYTSKQAAINYVKQKLIQEMDNNIHEILGGDVEHIRD